MLLSTVAVPQLVERLLLTSEGLRSNPIVEKFYTKYCLLKGATIAKWIHMHLPSYISCGPWFESHLHFFTI